LTWFNDKTVKIEKDQPGCKINCYAKRTSSIYVAADGSVYPCCWLGFYPGQMTHPGNNQIEQIMKENNALKYSLEHCLEWFNQVEKSWERDSIKNGKLYQCLSTCGKL
jgi:tellurite resistance protein